MPLYRIKSGKHRNGSIVYGVRAGEINEIELTPDQFESGVFSNLELVPIEADGGEGGSQSGDANPADGLDGLTKKQLQELASANGIEFETDANKATLIEKLRAAGVTA